MFNKMTIEISAKIGKQNYLGILLSIVFFVLVIVVVVVVKALQWIEEHGIYKAFTTSDSWVRR